MSAFSSGGPGISVQVDPNCFWTKSLSTAEADGGCWASNGNVSLEQCKGNYDAGTA